MSFHRNKTVHSQQFFHRKNLSIPNEFSQKKPRIPNIIFNNIEAKCLRAETQTAQFSDLSSLHRYQIHLMGFLVYILRKHPNDVADNNEVEWVLFLFSYRPSKSSCIAMTPFMLS